jgi:hypothetical protein
LQRYVEFQKLKRQMTVEEIRPHKLIRQNDATPGNKLFENWRSGYWPSPMAFANDFCVHPDLVSKYEDGIQKTMPKQIREILEKYDLIDSNWSDSFV